MPQADQNVSAPPSIDLAARKVAERAHKAGRSIAAVVEVGGQPVAASIVVVNRSVYAFTGGFPQVGVEVLRWL